jgi:hypothetical protein
LQFINETAASSCNLVSIRTGQPFLLWLWTVSDTPPN